MSYHYQYGTKNPKRYKPQLLLLCLLLLTGGVVAGTSVYRTSVSPEPKSPLARVVTSSTRPKVAQTSINYGLPVRVQIPKLSIDAHVINVGLTKDGNMSVPNNVIDAGWYKYGGLPGNSGTAVIAGHLDGLRGEPGVFSSLDKLAAGDVITVSGSNGQAVSFTVRETRSYGQNEQPPEVFKSTLGSHLNLITCTGSWDRSAHRFAKRLVVFADKST